MVLIVVTYLVMYFFAGGGWLTVALWPTMSSVLWLHSDAQVIRGDPLKVIIATIVIGLVAASPVWLFKLLLAEAYVQPVSGWSIRTWCVGITGLSTVFWINLRHVSTNVKSYGAFLLAQTVFLFCVAFHEKDACDIV